MREPTTRAQVLAQMSVISDCSAARIGDIIRGGNEKSREPAGPNQTLAEQYRHASFEDALQALEDARKRRLPTPGKDQDPEFGSPFWKHWAAKHPDPGYLVKQFGVSRQYVKKIRDQYGEKAA